MESKTETLWRIADAAAYLQVPRSAIYKMTCAKAKLRIPHIRIAARLRFRKDLIDSWLAVLTYSNVALLERIKGQPRRIRSGDS